jgi:hypothetical protein
VTKTLGIILIAIGLIIGVWGAVGFTTREKVLDIGPLQATRTTTRRIPYAPLFGGLVLVGGVVLVVTARKN